MSHTGRSYTAPPPAYSQVPSSEPSSSRDPHVGEEWDVPEDFKVGVNVSDCDVSIRMAFVRKVYSILFAQLFMSTVVAGIMMYNDSVKYWVQTNGWALLLSTISTFILLIAVLWKRLSHPLNLQLLAAFTLSESYCVGTVVTYYDTEIVLQALILTTGIFVGLTLFTMQSKYDFSGMFPYLYTGLWALVIVGFIGIFIPFSSGFDLAYGIIGALIFSGFIIYDTFNLMNRLSPELYVVAALELYLDFINLFLSILRILNDLNRS